MSNKSDPTTGSVADEAMKLMESLGMWATGSAPSGAEDGHSTTGGAPGGCSCGSDGADRAAPAHSPAVCRVCPVCRVGAFLEGLSPDVMERFADLIGMVAGSLQAVAQQRRSDAESQPPSADEPDRPTTRKVPVTGDAPGDEADSRPAGSAQ